MDLSGLYLAFCDFSHRFFDERGPGRKEVFLRVLLQAAVAAAHRAIPRHLQRRTPDSNHPTTPPSQNEFFWG